MLHEQQRNQTSGSTGHFENISIRTRDRQVNRGPATWWTVLALELINLGVASTIVSLTATFIFPLWVGLVIVAIGVAAGLMAIAQWRQYLAEMRQR